MLLFGDDPAAYFAGESYKAHHIPRAEIEQLQLAVAAARFDTLAKRIAPLQALSESQGIETIEKLSDLAKLLFPQSFYKSFDIGLLERSDFEGLAAWLQRLTVRPLSVLKGRQIATLDEFFALLERECGVRLVHSSGTTGRLSLFPRGSADWAAHLRNTRALIPSWTGREEDAYGPPPFAVCWCGFSGGHSAILGAADLFRYCFARSPELFFATTPGRLSVDWHWFMLQLDRARRLNAPQPPVTDYVLARLDEMEAGREQLDQSLDRMVEVLHSQIRGQRIAIGGPPMLVHQLAAHALAKGVEGVCGPGSALLTFGGTKNQGPVNELELALARFSGGAQYLDSYGMTEMLGPAGACEHGNYHLLFTHVPFLFDLDSGALLPRKGRQTGRFGVFDCMAQGNWGGVVSADKVTIDWNTCECGRETPTIVSSIARCPDADDALPPYAADPAAVEAALEALGGGTATAQV